jgi:hypothetical protein
MEPPSGDGTGRWANEVGESRAHRRFLAARIAVAFLVLAVLVAVAATGSFVLPSGDRVSARVGWREIAILAIAAAFVLWGIVKAGHGRRTETRGP